MVKRHSKLSIAMESKSPDSAEQEKAELILKSIEALQQMLNDSLVTHAIAIEPAKKSNSMYNSSAHWAEAETNVDYMLSAVVLSRKALELSDAAFMGLVQHMFFESIAQVSILSSVLKRKLALEIGANYTPRYGARRFLLHNTGFPIDHLNDAYAKREAGIDNLIIKNANRATHHVFRLETASIDSQNRNLNQDYYRKYLALSPL
jgi:hypothetical protein